jgi:hypothetical protein
VTFEVKLDPLKYALLLSSICFAVAVVAAVALLVQWFFPASYLPLLHEWPYVFGFIPLVLWAVFSLLLGVCFRRFAESQYPPMLPGPDRHD